MSGSGTARSTTAIVLFSDVVASTELRTRLGEERADDVRRGHDELLRDAVSARGGVVVKGTGDGLMAVFDAASEAIAAGVAMQQATDRFARQGAIDLRIRVGISAGDVSWEGSDCFGIPVVEASRLCAVADADGVLVSEIVRLLAGARGGHEYQPKGALALKGFPDPVVAHAVAWQALARPDLPLPRPLSVTSSVPFVGRQHARDVLRDAWKEAAAGGRRTVLVSGEPGIGKTRLVAELAREVHAAAGTVLFGRCDDELGVPYQPFAEGLGAFVGHCPPDAARDHLGPYAADLARLVPDLPAIVHGIGEPLRAEPETERLRLFEAFDLFLATTSSLAPVLLVLDDLHWAEHASLLLLRHLARSSREARVLVVGTYRDTDLGRSHPLADVLADLRREASVERLDLQGLDEGEVAAYVEAAAGYELDDVAEDLARRLHAETEGNPFFVGQVLRNLTESGALVQDDGRWVPADGALRLPEGVREVIGRRLSRLPDTTIGVLEVAAVMGREVDDRALIAAAEVGADDVLDALERAEAAHLLEPVAGARGRHAFVHALVRSTLYEELPTTRRLRLHRRIGEVLEARADDEAVLPELARHFAEAAALGEQEKAARYALRAAQAAWRRLAYEEAARLCAAAIDALDPTDPDADAALADLYVELQRSTSAGGDMAATAAITDRAAAFARRAGRPDVLARVALSRNGWRRFWADAGTIDPELVALLEEALEALPPDDQTLRPLCAARLATELYFDVDAADRREQLITEAEAAARASGDPSTLLQVLSSATFVRWIPGLERERVALVLEAQDLAVELGEKEIRASNQAWLVGAHLELFQRAEFDAAVAQFAALVEELGQPLYRWWARMSLGTQALLDGRFADAEVHANEAAAGGAQWVSSLQMYGVQLFALRRALGGLDELEPMTRSMVEQFPLVPAWRTALAFMCASSGRLDEAREHIHVVAADDFALLPFDANWPVGMSLVAYTAHAVGDAQLSARAYDRLLPFADQAVLAGAPADCLGSVSGYLALAAAGCGRWDDWDRHVRDARRHHEALRSPNLLAWWGLEEARVALERGDRARALAAAEDALAHAERIGATDLVRRARAVLDGDA